MTSKNQGFDYAKEKIRKALVYEYLKKHPGSREQDVILACQNGELVFTEISLVLADTEFRKQSSQLFKQANSMFAELAIHQDERWQDCVTSVQHCIQMIDCLHSSLFECLDNKERLDHEKFVKGQERLCSRITVRLYETEKQMKSNKIQKIAGASTKIRGLVLNYLNHVIDQLNVLHSILNRELELGDFFSEQVTHFSDVALDPAKKAPSAFNLDEIVKVYKALKGDKKATLNTAFTLNEKVLIETKKTLGNAVVELKKNLTQRRRQIQEIWAAISNLQQTVQTIDEIQTMDLNGNLPPLQPSFSSKASRMIRFLSRFNFTK